MYVEAKIRKSRSIAVLLATFNGERFICEQIDSILFQSGVRTTIYARDDGSTDGTRAILDRYVAAFPGRVVRLADAQRRFGAACENFFSMLVELQQAPHDYFAFADQDDIWLSDKLDRAVRQIVANDASGYASNLTAFSEQDQSEWVIRKDYPQRRSDYLFQSASAGCTYVFDAEVVRLIASRIGSVDEHDWSGMSHDWLCYAICRSHGLSWFIDDWSGIRYRQHALNQFGAMPGFSGVLKRLALVRRGWYRDVLMRNRCFLNPENAADQSILRRIERFNLRDRLWLALHATELRREPRAQLGLAVALLAGLL